MLCESYQCKKAVYTSNERRTLKARYVARAARMLPGIEQAEDFAVEWISAPNSQDHGAILSHCEDDFAVSHPVTVHLMNELPGCLKGRGDECSA
jgi:hypothetical protein